MLSKVHHIIHNKNIRTAQTFAKVNTGFQVWNTNPNDFQNLTKISLPHDISIVKFSQRPNHLFQRYEPTVQICPISQC